MLNIRRPLGRLIFNMGIAIPGKTVFLIETAPWYPLILLNPLQLGSWIPMDQTLGIPELQMSCTDFNAKMGPQDSSPSIGCLGDILWFISK